MKKSAQTRESHLRSIIKSITWRILASSITTLIVYIFMQDKPEIAFLIGGIELFIKMFVYYLHERVWNLVTPGTIRKIIPHKDKID
ncbi:MAG: DUF2061 domain-containing protein [Bacteroidetes bacterium]|jgi:uncharacterized membrane protein|nr:DUF2061 domain-containing protein [Bacteroidota bacterium]MBT6687417.1 DUF2061 domain-containing protein [Bacteroidota bacterium]MBT7144899.1 DUF2061 domain-containing protein [Bacteroidota bacterium]MBT7493327.1 DUF2061 domain-containing protein [Bacteroidota bacterium]